MRNDIDQSNARANHQFVDDQMSSQRSFWIFCFLMRENLYIRRLNVFLLTAHQFAQLSDLCLQSFVSVNVPESWTSFGNHISTLEQFAFGEKIAAIYRWIIECGKLIKSLEVSLGDLCRDFMNQGDVTPSIESISNPYS